ncbi:hypothetical protein ES703_30747 [subsurface metagenome]
MKSTNKMLVEANNCVAFIGRIVGMKVGRATV